MLRPQLMLIMNGRLFLPVLNSFEERTFPLSMTKSCCTPFKTPYFLQNSANSMPICLIGKSPIFFYLNLSLSIWKSKHFQTSTLPSLKSLRFSLFPWSSGIILHKLQNFLLPLFVSLPLLPLLSTFPFPLFLPFKISLSPLATPLGTN